MATSSETLPKFFIFNSIWLSLSFVQIKKEKTFMKFETIIDTTLWKIFNGLIFFNRKFNHILSLSIQYISQTFYCLGHKKCGKYFVVYSINVTIKGFLSEQHIEERKKLSATKCTHRIENDVNLWFAWKNYFSFFVCEILQFDGGFVILVLFS